MEGGGGGGKQGSLEEAGVGQGCLEEGGRGGGGGGQGSPEDRGRGLEEDRPLLLSQQLHQAHVS